ncbi:hypothetical protein HZ326_22205 [Fusarium oxysporum f. sp. albedinis]|nr:hypothetical protein HZ326_22205 [Fusarium oxysporum f. sp. albedinis]
MPVTVSFSACCNRAMELDRVSLWEELEMMFGFQCGSVLNIIEKLLYTMHMCIDHHTIYLLWAIRVIHCRDIMYITKQYCTEKFRSEHYPYQRTTHTYKTFLT